MWIKNNDSTSVCGIGEVARGPSLDRVRLLPRRKSFYMPVSLVLFSLLLLVESAVPADAKISITVYNNNLALVRDVRTVRVEKGNSVYKFQDVAAQIDPTSVYFKSRTAPEQVQILEQNFEYDVVSSDKILEKYLDEKIILSGKDATSYSGTLLNASGGDVILREDDGGVKIISKAIIEHMAFPNLPEGLITRPTLVWSVDSQRAGDHQIEVGYLTGGLQWHAEYVGVANDNDTELELGGWVSIDNRSGASYRNAQLRLVAGDVHLAQPERIRSFEVQAMKQVPDQFKEEAFFEYHLYTLQRPATVANNQIKQLALFDPTPVPVNKKYTYDGQRDGKKVRVNLEFMNEKQRGLGFPLPKGKVRVYKKDQADALIFVGEDFVEHTPKDEQVRVYVGNAFDIVGERIQKNRQSISNETWEETWQVSVRNHKEERVTVTIVEHMYLDWEIVRSSYEFKKKDASTIEFEVTVPKDGEVTVEYLARFKR